MENTSNVSIIDQFNARTLKRTKANIIQAINEGYTKSLKHPAHVKGIAPAETLQTLFNVGKTALKNWFLSTPEFRSAYAKQTAMYDAKLGITRATQNSKRPTEVAFDDDVEIEDDIEIEDNSEYVAPRFQILPDEDETEVYKESILQSVNPTVNAWD
jgi:hypothetical protein